jgi:hypothetical protein
MNAALVRMTLEIDATIPTGAPEQVVRTGNRKFQVIKI